MLNRSVYNQSRLAAPEEDLAAHSSVGPRDVSNLEHLLQKAVLLENLRRRALKLLSTFRLRRTLLQNMELPEVRNRIFFCLPSTL